jgi:Ser/Thr protein kinase RdoA (MazF antagonist)
MAGMKPFAELGVRGKLRRLRGVAANALGRYGLDPRSKIALLNHSENTTYRLDDPRTGKRRVLRVHRTGYHTEAGIRSELLWMKVLNDEAGVHTPQAIPGTDGELIQRVDAAGMDEPRHVVLFEWVEGRVPDQTRLVGPFERLGELSARMHRHVLGWKRPAWFERLVWDADTTIGRNVNWGHWEDGPAMTKARLALLRELADALGERLKAFGKKPDRYNLVHADMRLANLLIYEGDPRVLDFDDSGFSWFLYDFGTATSFIEERPEVPDLVASWLKGYRKVRELSAADEAEIPTFVMLRRLMILGWIASHSGTDLARELGPEYTAGTCRLARTFLEAPETFLSREKWAKRKHQPEAVRIIRN